MVRRADKKLFARLIVCGGDNCPQCLCVPPVSRHTNLSLSLWPSAKRGAHVVWFSGGTETRRGDYGFFETTKSTKTHEIFLCRETFRLENTIEVKCL